MPYLAGYLADKYDVSEEESVGRANKRVKNRQKSICVYVKGYSSVTTENSSIRCKMEKQSMRCIRFGF